MFGFGIGIELGLGFELRVAHDPLVEEVEHIGRLLVY